MADELGLKPEQERVLRVYEARRIRAGFGLTLQTIAHEIPGVPERDLRRTLDGMAGTGLLQVMPEVADYYLLTRDGERFFNPLA